MLNEEELAQLHDYLCDLLQVSREMDEIDAETFLQGAVSLLCWLLGHDHPNYFSELFKKKQQEYEQKYRQDQPSEAQRERARKILKCLMN